MLDVLLKLDRLEAIMTEVPLILRYDYKQGKSKMKVIKTIQETISLGYHEKLDRLKNEIIKTESEQGFEND
jgi:dolichol-phosphate mannosyltransferase